MKADWASKKLRDICTLINGRAYRRSELLPEGKYPVLRVGNFFTNNYWYYSNMELDPNKYCQRGDLLYAWSASFGPRIWTGEKVIFHYHIWKVLPDSSLVDKKFLYFWFLWDAAGIKADQGAGTTMIHVSKGSMEDRNIMLPPLLDQRRIIEVLDEAFAEVSTAKANAAENLRNARSLFESILDFAVQGRLSSQDLEGESVDQLLNRIEQARTATSKHRRTNRTGSASFGAEPLPFKTPDNWKWVPLDELTIGISDGVHSKPTYVEKGIPFVTVKNLTSGPGISFDGTRYITPQDHEQFIMRTKPERGDILITKDGTIGVVRAVETDVVFSIFVSVALIKPALKDLTPYLTYALQATCVQDQIVPRGAALKHLYLVDLRRLVIPLPPYLEQVQISKRLDSIKEETQRLESIYQQKLAALDELKESLLHQAFSGQL